MYFGIIILFFLLHNFVCWFWPFPFSLFKSFSSSHFIYRIFVLFIIIQWFIRTTNRFSLIFRSFKFVFNFVIETITSHNLYQHTNGRQYFVILLIIINDYIVYIIIIDDWIHRILPLFLNRTFEYQTAKQPIRNYDLYFIPLLKIIIFFQTSVYLQNWEETMTTNKDSNNVGSMLATNLNPIRNVNENPIITGNICLYHQIFDN